MPTRTERLDSLPFSSKHRRLLWGSGVGWALDAMDVGLISFVMAALAVQWDLSKTQLSWIGSIGFLGMALGAALGGLLADRIGRRQVFALTLLVYGLATGAAALSVSVAMLVVLRFIVGLGLGAELPVASTLVAEFSPKRIRGRIIVILEAFWALGWMLAALIGYFVIPASDNGWRWALAMGMVPAAYAIYVRMRLPESVRFLETKGRVAEAEAIVREFEEAAGKGAEAAGVAGAGVAGAGAAVERASAVEEQHESIWAPRLRARTAALWAVWFCINFSYYGAFIWLPSLLVDRGFDLIHSFGYTLIITLAQLPGYALAAWLIEILGRRVTLALFLVGSGVSAALFGFSGDVWQVIATGCALSFFNLGAWGALYAIGPELYPTATRGSGTGSAAAFGRLASISAPLLVPVLLVGGQGAVFGVFAAAFLVAAAAAFTLPERTNVALE
ncbi:MFS transporter [Corynebacterium spheniscorum]|uniref:MFS transporter, putative metabolite:H+ symporter n=1 Tax=Corynebacterium spheniscorum TaxID=185761 RepID=A0A1I2RTZ8_9CORY|nr:MFS transporter [Corynebacterium spheniscorum]KAA8720969.1 MFS transporter [Corynebacterium spheniscorum]SFG43940.1 MFS transporter, putative metabolite:H+ symporter [Corynebacterium spheniscorum]